jgi:hypothetical protein
MYKNKLLWLKESRARRVSKISNQTIPSTAKINFSVKFFATTERGLKIE